VTFVLGPPSPLHATKTSTRRSTFPMRSRESPAIETAPSASPPVIETYWLQKKKRKKKNEDARNPIGLLRTVSRAATVVCVLTAARPTTRALHRSLLPGCGHGQDGGGPPHPCRGGRSQPGALLLERFGRDVCAPWTASAAAYSMAADQGTTARILEPLAL